MSSPPRDQSAFKRNLPYARYPRHQVELLMDLYRPDVEQDVPVVLWLHSGGWRAGSKDHCVIRWLVRFGYAVATINYRLLPRFKYPAPIQDTLAAVRYLRGRSQALGLLPEAIAVAGASTGGYLANMVGVLSHNPTALGILGSCPDAEPGEFDHQAAHVNAVVNYFGFTDFVELQNLPNRRTNKGLTTPEARFLGVLPRNDFDLAASASPAFHVHPDAPPFIHLHGERDEVVPLEQSRRFHDALLEHGVTSKLVLAKQAKHGDHTLFNEESARGKVIDFLNRHMAGYVPAEALRENVVEASSLRRPDSDGPFRLRITG